MKNFKEKTLQKTLLMLFNGCAQENVEKKIYRIIRDASEVRR